MLFFAEAATASSRSTPRLWPLEPPGPSPTTTPFADDIADLLESLTEDGSCGLPLGARRHALHPRKAAPGGQLALISAVTPLFMIRPTSRGPEASLFAGIRAGWPPTAQYRRFITRFYGPTPGLEVVAGVFKRRCRSRCGSIKATIDCVRRSPNDFLPDRRRECHVVIHGDDDQSCLRATGKLSAERSMAPPR